MGAMDAKHTKTITLILTLILFVTIGLASSGFAQRAYKNFPTAPIKNGTAKWRIGYLQGGDYNEYHISMDATIKGLMALGWIKEAPLPVLTGANGESLWKYYTQNLESDYLEFVPDGFYSSEWRPEKRKTLKAKITQRLNETDDLDLMIAMGTGAGIDLAQGDHHTPTIVLAVSDAVTAGIIKTIHDSGNQYIHARVDPHRYERQIRIFHTIIGFKTIGMIYTDDIEGRSYAAIDKVKKVAREKGFKIRTCFLDKSPELEQEEDSLIQCCKILSASVDALYITGQRAVNEKTIPILAAIAKEAQLPTFSQSGYQEVQKGLLLSISQSGYKYVGKFYAETMAKIFNGALPGELYQIFEDLPKIAINLSTAEALSFYPNLNILSSADEIYREIPDENRD
jgi:ABC-type uncharacterized transport system substrate-binding protein